MKSQRACNQIYTQTCISVTGEGPTGEIVADVINHAISLAQAHWAVISDTDISGGTRCDLLTEGTEVRVLTTQDLVRLIESADQVVWASLFFCRKESDALLIRGDESYVQSTSKSDVVVRVVDATYIYVIAPRENTVCWRDRFEMIEVKETTIDQIDFPE
jgi:hypothetical protein